MSGAGTVTALVIGGVAYTVETDPWETAWGTVLRIRVWRDDEAPVRDWPHLQAIKNAVAGDERTAVEIYPPQAALVDDWPCYHLWVLPLGMALPFGYDAPAPKGT